MRIFRVEIVLADIDHGKLEKLREVHLLVEHALAERALAEETYCDPAVAKALGRKCCSRRNTCAAAYDRIRSKVAGRRVCNVHGTALALAVPGLLTQQFGEHLIGGGTLRQTMSMTAMRAGDVVGGLERFTYADRDRLFTDVQMRQTGHQCPGVEFVDLGFKLPDRNHLPVHAEPQIDFFQSFSWLCGSRHFCTPDMRARTSNMTAKSNFSQPIPRAAVKNSLLMAVVGTGTFSLRPN